METQEDLKFEAELPEWFGNLVQGFATLVRKMKVCQFSKRFSLSYVRDDYKDFLVPWGWGLWWLSTEVAFAVLTQQPQV